MAARAKRRTAKPGDPGVDKRGQLVDVQAFVWHILGRQPGQYAGEQGVVDDSQDWYRQIKASGLPRGNADGVRPKQNGFFGITAQVGAGGPRGAIFLPTDQPDGNNFYAHEILLLEDAPGGKLVYAWRDRGAQNGQPPPVFVQPEPVDPEEPGGEEPSEPGNGGEVEDQGEIVKQLEALNATAMQQLREQEKTTKAVLQLRAAFTAGVKELVGALSGGGGLLDILRRRKPATRGAAKKKTTRRR